MSIIQQAVDKLAHDRTTQPDMAERRTDDHAETPRGREAAIGRGPGPRDRIALNRDELQAAGLLPPDELAQQAAGELRRVKGPLLRNAFGAVAGRCERANLIVITSALPGAGKTFTSLNLALNMSFERDRSVLLVDGDVAKPDISRRLGLVGRPGLLGCLMQDGAALDDFIVDTDVPTLAVLPAGRYRPDATELLSSNRMQDLADQLARADRIVIFDSPPLLVTNEAQVLAGMVGQIVLVVEADATPRPAVQQAIEMLDPAKAINLVLNKSRHSLLDAYEGYYGGQYNYGDET